MANFASVCCRPDLDMIWRRCWCLGSNLPLSFEQRQYLGMFGVYGCFKHFRVWERPFASSNGEVRDGRCFQGALILASVLFYLTCVRVSKFSCKKVNNQDVQGSVVKLHYALASMSSILACSRMCVFEYACVCVCCAGDSS